ncbi:YbaN family protein [Shewanella intestini]|uniref:Inner membrane protein n=1 Tax=Shewanella intestini TaxID=2017544 RepID=A0ABS5I4L9_9GAMM|nr:MULTISPECIES: YbaN family protein [Shewanella]MBR9728964.1 DUF454 domain-containing protein [Shewanella intestini]MRG36970.1 DUF454 family protein [Shewanella sp. XMDDZSB0408]
MVIKRGFFLVIGLVSLSLGVIGIALPLLPTVPFILLAAYCFARSSTRLHHWLMTHPWFAKSLTSWQQQRALPKGVKRKATVMTTVSFTISILIVPLMWVKIMLFCMLCGLLFYLRRIPDLTE